MHPRRTARESILGALYAYELTGEEKNKVLLDAFERNSFDEETKIYISNLYDNILENKTWAENLISDNLNIISDDNSKVNNNIQETTFNEKKDI